MNFINTIGVCFFVVTLSSFSVFHKYYVSNTQIEYVEHKKSVQIITRIFIDDFENVLKERYYEDLSFDDEDALLIDEYISRYLNEKLKLIINGEHKALFYLGKELELGIAKCYLEIEDVDQIKTLKVTNQTLFDLFTDQQNIVKLNVNAQKKSFVLTKQNDNAVLNFN